jgi:hypothetical protein
MTAVSPITRQTVGRTFIAASTALGIGALAQLGVIAWFFMARFHTPPPLAGAPEVPGATSAAPRNFTDPFADAGAVPMAGAPSPLATATPPPRPPTPQPVTQEALAAAPAEEPSGQDRFIELVEQARALRERGDTYAAVTKLKEAETFDERNPIAPAELAMTYEKMGFAEKAAEYWRRIYEMGDAAGIYFAAAEGRLKASQAAAQRDATAAVTLPQPAPAPAAPAAGTSAEKVGLSADSKLGLLEITRRDMVDEGATKKFILSVPVKARARARIDVRDVVVQVLFYDVVNERTVERTNAQVSYKWAAPPADWSDDDLETLEVTYTLPAPHVSDEVRKYYGYLVLVYYKNALQDFRSDPARLGKEMPPPRQLATESSE